MSVVGNGNNGVGSESTARKPGQKQMAGAMPQQGAYVMGDNECAPQKLVRLIGCRDSRIQPERPGFDFRTKQFGQR
ncbi:hypothetical protein JQ615_15025 [Bradyrhizobium jicamae]|uniref:Uncharacterized protein n=1 Tax=Bradyrhizobium jicamae TaxID=280332 RepID=A0ABS5FIX9_9BRAD|nr:hypothetical protein [Bradyrhizobium jicamae]MBR0796706.1 hypothetical protein [Bradyrhizobium jicamae]MBR0935446.1 hypothetical protein [Bradyrhizobium jicamae]